jgi:hypothetical protein
LLLRVSFLSSERRNLGDREFAHLTKRRRIEGEHYLVFRDASLHKLGSDALLRIVYLHPYLAVSNLQIRQSARNQTFKYTRIEVEGTFGRLAAGETIASIIAGYDGRVTQEAIEIATRHLIETLPQAIAA